MRHTFEVDGVLINPELPEDFDCTLNDEKSKEEIVTWLDKPYIVIEELQLESWEEHYHRLKSYDSSDEEIGSREKYLKELDHLRKMWFETWHTGFRYNVRCLDYGARDGSTNYGMYATFEEALAVAKTHI